MAKTMLIGGSGIGKTTLAKNLASRLGIEFKSGSYSDLVPRTREMSHQSMITSDIFTIIREDYQVIQLRNKQLKDSDNIITDRSFIDSIAYFIQKLSHRINECEVQDFIDNCEKIMSTLDDMKFIYIPFSANIIDKWDMEHNGKRILNVWYQAQVTAIIDYLLEYYTITYTEVCSGEYRKGYIHIANKVVPILILDTMEFANRIKYSAEFLKDEHV